MVVLNHQLEGVVKHIGSLCQVVGDTVITVTRRIPGRNAADPSVVSFAPCILGAFGLIGHVFAQVDYATDPRIICRRDVP